MVRTAAVFLLAVAAAVGIGLRGWLTTGGVMAALLVGIGIFAGTGGWGLSLVLVFFVSSSALSRLPGAGAGRGGRTGAQVLANGGVAFLAGLGALVACPGVMQYAVAGAVAAATADTWATEIGTLAGGPTRSITSWEPVVPGTSGGVSAVGCLAGVAGATLIGAVAAALRSEPLGLWLAVVVTGGTGGMFADSVLGASVEGRRPWMGNEAVNVGGTAVGAALAWLLAGAVL